MHGLWVEADIADRLHGCRGGSRTKYGDIGVNGAPMSVNQLKCFLDQPITLRPQENTRL